MQSVFTHPCFSAGREAQFVSEGLACLSANSYTTCGGDVLHIKQSSLLLRSAEVNSCIGCPLGHLHGNILPEFGVSFCPWCRVSCPSASSKRRTPWGRAVHVASPLQCLGDTPSDGGGWRMNACEPVSRPAWVLVAEAWLSSLLGSMPKGQHTSP